MRAGAYLKQAKTLFIFVLNKQAVTNLSHIDIFFQGSFIFRSKLTYAAGVLTLEVINHEKNNSNVFPYFQRAVTG